MTANNLEGTQTSVSMVGMMAHVQFHSRRQLCMCHIFQYITLERFAITEMTSKVTQGLR